MGTVLIVDDVEDLRFSLTNAVRKQGYSASSAGSGAEAMEVLQSQVIELVFLDIGLPDSNGIDLIGSIKEVSPEIEIVMLTGINNAKTAVQSLREGAVDYIVKPFDLLEFTTVLNRIMQSRLMAKQAMLAAANQQNDNLIGTCKPMVRVKETLAMAANVDSPVLITGETGTGKELVARAIHQSGCGQKGVFVKIDCGTLSPNLIESELFGHRKGAFTDAHSDKKGLVEIASDGTLFLDEIGNLPLTLQPKVLRLIEESVFRRVGGVKDTRVKVRIIAATNADLLAQTTAGTFREDLYYRLNVLPIELPPLRVRGEDIRILAETFLHSFNRELKKDIKGFSPSGLATLKAHNWPGNIRELRNLIEREVLFCKTEWLTLNTLRPALTTHQLQQNGLLSLRDHTQEYIRKVLRYTKNNKSQAARILQISRTTLREKLN